MQLLVAVVALLCCGGGVLVTPVHGTEGPSPLELIRVDKVEVVRDFGNSSISVQASPATFKHGDNITVSWSGVSKPSLNDWIGAYLQHDDVKNTAPIKFQFAAFSKDYLKTGSGSFVFRLMNMRDDYVFVFFRDGLEKPKAATASNPVKVENANEPLQGRVSLTNDTTSMKVSWTTRNSTSPVVRWGFSSGEYTHTAHAHSYTYTTKDMCGPPAVTVGFRSPGLFHSAIITNLSPGQRVYYIFGDDKHGFSKEHSFRHAPAPGAAVNAIAFGDLGQHVLDHSLQQTDMAPSRNTTDGIEAEIADKHLLMHIGDISYARGYVSQWEQFHDQIEPIATSLPYMTAIGNHERDWPGTGARTTGNTDSGGECGVAYELRFPMPTESRDEPWYAFDFGVLHVIMISTEQDFKQGSKQHDYIMRDLKSIDRTKTPWVIFAGHRPFYIDSTNWEPHGGDQTVAEDMRKTYEDVLFDNKVDLIFGAHHHSYQRTCHVYQNKCVNTTTADGYRGPVTVDIGMAGAGNSQNIQNPQPEIFKFVDDSHHGFTRIMANMTHFHMQYVRGDDRKVHDEFVLVK
ncbi:hypothetical protein PTSG_08549 [Salpingoeca rosetta]|uniref:Purple acid phosphatase n=1 Tax=Salpingoeca rosetta (strain ATCC 50818 / BSB-021) TaxID=946362 RepID=F2UK05_SALR5|nr:uncharacterized protein PTSG_08549 [Salpingoeca rosetta]EGD77454.1 hypothetical protein PTSG_08549 [Salpingoeca rosetta]|eukprot:XP_004990342.1 hypothetical protein PTSG_08549 [Salpingoeca rosetta]